MRKSKNILGMGALLLAFVLLLGWNVTAKAADAGVIALGADLSESQRAKVLEFLGVPEEALSSYSVIAITNDQEHQYLDAYLEPSVIGTRSLSSVKVTPLEEGSGLNITTHNISYCTISMYQNALVTAGLKDAEVVVAGPSNISGTAALIGAVKAYEVLTGTAVDDSVLETATQELVVMGELGQALGDSEAASEIVAYIKQKILETGVGTGEEISGVIEEAFSRFRVDLGEGDVNKVQDLMENFSKIDLDSNAMAQQAKELYGKIQDLGLEVNSERVGNFFTNLLREIMKFLGKVL